MRKILLSCSVVLLFACANEDGLENNSLDSGKGNNNTTIRARSVDFDLLFNNYVHSNSFINLNQIYDISLTLCKDQYEKCLFN